MNPNNPFRSLRHRNFRLYFTGQAVSLIGRWVQQVALSWLVFRLTGSSVLLGAVFFLSQAPMLVIGPVAGIWVDRCDRRALILAAQSLMAVQATVFAIAYFMDAIQPWHILSMALILGILNSIDTPARLSIVSQLVEERDDLANAIALNSFAFNIARFIGPPVAGALLEFTSEGVCFSLNAASLLVVVAAMAMVKVSPNERVSGPLGGAFVEGISYAWTSYPIRILIINLVVFNFVAASYVTLMPVFVTDVFDSGPQSLGLLLGAAGCGALAAAGYLALRRSVRGLTSSIAVGSFIAAMALLSFSIAGSVWIAGLLLFAVGYSLVVTNASTNTILQTIVADPLRGRVLSLHAWAVQGMAALGGLFAGSLGDVLGAQGAIAAVAIVLGAWALAFLAQIRRLRAHMRKIYEGLKL
ncbi:MFS transporter [Noviherbaspirillum denitrificans]|uniref:Major facilitator superfamily (MFS) profile domain-containing protein n=1 Tax=Noviherbaspirillum denitrificans TaxID=1968433 RepID=A0A254TJY7_9BURK|nr:MFS transporter [Noviherbaspirillum denitrificans]OWW20913.1 hypothetical protein AYR66_17005 [Noviherbaspirillum denitrificans]